MGVGGQQAKRCPLFISETAHLLVLTVDVLLHPLCDATLPGKEQPGTEGRLVWMCAAKVFAFPHKATDPHPHSAKQCCCCCSKGKSFASTFLCFSHWKTCGLRIPEFPGHAGFNSTLEWRSLRLRNFVSRHLFYLCSR